MSNPLPTDLELLIYIANQSGFSYPDTYSIWRIFHRRPDSYIVTETILYIAKSRRIPLMVALHVWRHGLNDSY